MCCAIVEVKNAKKYFKLHCSLVKRLAAPFARREQICALKSMSFTVDHGEVLGIVEANGAGKTTLLRILADLLALLLFLVVLVPVTLWINNVCMRIAKKSGAFTTH